MKISGGKIKGAQKVVLYGPEGIGKTTFAAQMPRPLFIDTEGGTRHLDVRRFEERPGSWAMLLEQVKYVLNQPEVCQTLVVDTADWAEALCVQHICAKAQLGGLEDFGYGKGYVYLQEEFARLLHLLDELVEGRQINVLLTAHAAMRKFEQPQEMGAYDRWELKLSKKVAPLVKEWADLLLFANYEVFTVTDSSNKHKKAQGGERVMYAAHHPCWDAKNRQGLPDKLPFDYGAIAHIFAAAKETAQPQEPVKAETVQPKAVYGETPISQLPPALAALMF
ncbi:MAG: ATP-binding protein, partial [Clostridium sp.]|nr:ATP-binding protein [Clostridium sp.]